MADLLKAVVQAKVSGPPQFQDGICDCFSDCGICVQSIFCSLCTFANILNKRETMMTGCDCGTFCATMVCGYITGNDYYLSLVFGFRRELVQRYGILEESVCKSCLLSVCCGPCTFCQVQREMGKRGEHCGGCCANPPANQSGLPNVAQMAIQAGGAVLHGGAPIRVWGSGICNCAGAPDCCEGLWCSPCMMGFMNNKLDTGRLMAKPPGMPNQMDVPTCCAYLFAPYASVYAHRREIIERYNIVGESHTTSCCYVYACTLCAICQQRREMGYSNEYPGGICLKDAPPRGA
jgi:Cys-rich protein (TIGR01571 family)